jgi:hypothetical protein
MLVWWLVPLVWAQAYENQPCKPSPDLGAELAAGQVSAVSPEGPWMRLTKASSLLAPSASSKPDRKAAAALVASSPGLELGDEDAGLGRVADDMHACSYGAPRLVDGDPSTAWCEGAQGPGIGAVVVVPLRKGASSLEVRNGSAKSTERFAQNGRARAVEVVLLGQGWSPPVQGEMAADLPVLGRHEVELNDVDAWQPVALPAVRAPVSWKPGNPQWAGDPSQQVPSFVALRIVSVWPGSTWQDICVSELRAL